MCGNLLRVKYNMYLFFTLIAHTSHLYFAIRIIFIIYRKYGKYTHIACASIEALSIASHKSWYNYYFFHIQNIWVYFIYAPTQVLHRPQRSFISYRLLLGTIKKHLM